MTEVWQSSRARTQRADKGEPGAPLCVGLIQAVAHRAIHRVRPMLIFELHMAEWPICILWDSSCWQGTRIYASCIHFFAGGAFLKTVSCEVEAAAR